MPFRLRVIASPIWSESGYGSKEDRRLNARLCKAWQGGLSACVFWTDCCRNIAITFCSSTFPTSLRILASFSGLAALCRNRAASKGTALGPQESRKISATSARVGSAAGQGICTGWAQDGLSARGKEQAEQAPAPTGTLGRYDGAWPLHFVSSCHQAGKLLKLVSSIESAKVLLQLQTRKL